MEQNTFGCTFTSHFLKNLLPICTNLLSVPSKEETGSSFKYKDILTLRNSRITLKKWPL